MSNEGRTFLIVLSRTVVEELSRRFNDIFSHGVGFIETQITDGQHTLPSIKLPPCFVSRTPGLGEGSGLGWG